MSKFSCVRCWQSHDSFSGLCNTCRQVEAIERQTKELAQANQAAKLEMEIRSRMANESNHYDLFGRGDRFVDAPAPAPVPELRLSEVRIYTMSPEEKKAWDELQARNQERVAKEKAEEEAKKKKYRDLWLANKARDDAKKIKDEEEAKAIRSMLTVIAVICLAVGCVMMLG